MLAKISVILFAVLSLWALFFSNKNRISKNNVLTADINQAKPYLLPITDINYLPLRNWNIQDLALDARAAVSYDVKSEKVLYQKNAGKKLAVASLTKVMTAVAVIENMDLNENVKVPASAIERSVLAEGGKDLAANEILKAEDLLKIMLIVSSNDAAFSFQEHFKNKGLDLVEIMNNKAIQLGMVNSHFTDPAGLDDTNAYSTAEDLVKIVSYSLKYPLIHQIMGTLETVVYGELPERLSGDYSIGSKIPHDLKNTNKLLGNLPEVVSGKTGFTDGALESMILVTKSPDGDRIISVLLGSYDKFLYTKNLVNWVEGAYIWK